MGHFLIVGIFIASLKRDAFYLLQAHVQGAQIALVDAAIETIVDMVGDAAEETLAGIVA